MGIAVFGSIGIASYRARLDESIAAAVPPEQTEAARETLGGANEAAT
jgi:hypothetical protein